LDFAGKDTSRLNVLAPPRPLRIAHVITRLINGGADENTVISCNQAVRSRHHVTLIHGGETRPEILTRVDEPVKTVELPSLVRPIAPLADVRAVCDLVRTFHGLRPDVVHTHTSKAGILGRVAARAASVPVVVHGVHIVPFVNVGRLEAFAYLRAERAVEGITDAFVDVSAGVRDLCVKAGVGEAARHHVVESGFELSRFRAASPPVDWGDLLQIEPGDPRPPVVLMLAVFEARKRHTEFLERIPRVVARSPHVRFVFAGDGPLRDAMEARVRTLGIERNVVFTGFHQHPEQLIALADIGLIASVREGLPRVLMQYLAGGTPIVATDLPCIDDVLRPDVNGLVVGSDDLDGLADAVVALLEDPARRARLARGAAATELSEWDVSRMGERLEAIYAEVIRERRRRPVRQPGVSVTS
jgi:glycosyltransferase involved in cell wall biosynthesis